MSAARKINRLTILLGLSLTSVLAGCASEQTLEESTTYPITVKERHPIRITEGGTDMKVFVGTGRGRLTDVQRTEIVRFAREWRKEATSIILVELPKGTPNDVAAKDVSREIRSLLSHGGAPSAAVKLTHYMPEPPMDFAPIRLSYQRIEATAGPCGLWPNDLGTATDIKTYQQNLTYFNYGCATQRNLAAMISNPQDLVQPRSEGPVYQDQRSLMLEKYRMGSETSSARPRAQSASSAGGN